MGMTMSPAGTLCRAPRSRRAWVFDESELERYAQPGTGGIRGRVFLARGDRILYGAEMSVALCPDAGFFDLSLADIDPRLARYVRKVITDEKGNFRFEGLPDGGYRVTCLFDALAGPPILLGGRAEVVDGNEVAVVLVRRPRP